MALQYSSRSSSLLQVRGGTLAQAWPVVMCRCLYLNYDDLLPIARKPSYCVLNPIARRSSLHSRFKVDGPVLLSTRFNLSSDCSPLQAPQATNCKQDRTLKKIIVLRLEFSNSPLAFARHRSKFAVKLLRIRCSMLMTPLATATSVGHDVFLSSPFIELPARTECAFSQSST